MGKKGELNAKEAIETIAKPQEENANLEKYKNEVLNVWIGEADQLKQENATLKAELSGIKKICDDRGVNY